MTTIQAVPSRSDLITQVVGAAAVTAALVGLTAWGLVPLLVGVAALQLFLVLGFLALVDAPAAVGVFVIGTAAAVAADLVVGLDDGQINGLSAVVALSFIAGLLLQLVRRQRTRVTESLADTLVAVVLVCCAACLPAAQQVASGEWVVRAGLIAAGSALVLVRLGGRLLPRPALAPSGSRSWPGLLLGLTLGTAAAIPASNAHLERRDALLVGLAAAATAAIADLVVDLAAAELEPTAGDERRMAALRPVGVLLPFALLGPVLLLAARLLET